VRSSRPIAAAQVTARAGPSKVAGHLDLPAPVPLQLRSGQGVVAPEQLPPSAVAHLGGAFGRAGDVGEQDRGQDPIRHRWGPGAGEELLDLGRKGPGVADE
jgi:hypothetical protein